MPRYFFDVLREGGITRDTNGDDLANKGEVRDMVVALLIEMAEEVIEEGDRAEITISTRNARGQPVYQASLAYGGAWGPGQ